MKTVYSFLDEESDEELKELAKEELNEAKKRVEELENEIKILLLPKDPNDDKDIIVEIRAGAGGDEAALFAAEMLPYVCALCRESKRWKVEAVNADEIRHRWYEGSQLHGHRTGCIFCIEI